MTYIGSSDNILFRWKIHIKSLVANKHHNYKMQKDFDEHGITYFTFEILELTDSLDKDTLELLEQSWINKYDRLYNIYSQPRKPKYTKGNGVISKRKKRKRNPIRTKKDRRLQARYDALKA